MALTQKVDMRDQKTVEEKGGGKEKRRGRGKEEKEKRRKKEDKKGMETNIEYGSLDFCMDSNI